jgi:hypothetical protein
VNPLPDRAEPDRYFAREERIADRMKRERNEARAEVERLREAGRRAVRMLHTDDWTPEDRDAVERAFDEDRDG